jgi:hypothetical protein
MLVLFVLHNARIAKLTVILIQNPTCKMEMIHSLASRLPGNSGPKAPRIVVRIVVRIVRQSVFKLETKALQGDDTRV